MKKRNQLFANHQGGPPLLGQRQREPLPAYQGPVQQQPPLQPSVIPYVPTVGVITLPERGGTSKGGASQTVTLPTYSGVGVVFASGANTVTVAEGVLDQVATNVTVGNTAVETTVYSVTVPGGTLGDKGKLRLRFYWRAKQDIAGLNSTTITLRFKYGSTTLIALAGINVNSTSLVDQYCECELSGDTSTNAQLGRVLAIGNVPGAQIQGISRGTSAVDSTLSQTLTVTLQWSTADGPAQSAVMEHATLEVVK
jgi:hypothetical protein